jgi:DNA helicase IV
VPVPTTHDPELAREQDYVDTLYRRLDELRDLTRDQLRHVLLDGGTGTPQSLVERDAFAATHADRLAKLDAAEGRLCFGVMDHADGRRTYVGRIGLSDRNHEPMLVDWRAPVATAFYRATLADPYGLRLRRHLRTKGREVTGIADDVLDASGGAAASGAAVPEAAAVPGTAAVPGAAGSPAAPAEQAPSAGRTTGDALLLEALSAPRTGRMQDIIMTLQAEQDRVIRTDGRRVLVVDGGPGTGKTAVALHRTAYLLYTDRERLARSGVLVVGPNPTFLRYIDQVLPSLGETGVVFSTPSRLFPGVDATGAEDVGPATLKGDPRMADLIAAAVRDRQHLPEQTVEIAHDEGVVLRLDEAVVAKARTRARRSRRPHNGARRVFITELLTELTDQAVAQIPGGLIEPGERREVTAGLLADARVRREIGVLWPRLSPQRLLTELFGSPDLLAGAAGAAGLTAAECALLARPAGAVWTPADVPLLDEAAELLGDPDAGTAAEHARRAAAERAAEQRYAQGVLEILGLTGTVDAESVAQRWAGPGRRRSAAEHAENDREWAFGHLVVDEAQDVSPMLWRLLWRRCPTKTATLVGDLAQAASPAAARSWAAMLRPHIGDRFRVERLTVNYRTPQEIMDVAADVLAAANPGARPPESVRSAGRAPSAVRAPAPAAASGAAAAVSGAAAVVDAVVDEAIRSAGEVGDGRVAVICPPGLVGPVRAALAEAAPGLVGHAAPAPHGGPGHARRAGRGTSAAAADGAPPESVDPLDARVAVVTVADCKGLEFDAVVLAEPAAILAGPTRGAADLYVALTRATRFLTVVHTADLPPMLARLTR